MCERRRLRADRTIRVWDSPELQNGAEKLRREWGGHIDVLLYCINVSATRCVVSEMVPGIRKVTQALGPAVWRHAIVVLIFANILEKRIIEDPTSDKESDGGAESKYVSFISQWKVNICRALQRAGVDQQVPLEPAGSLHLPGQRNWLDDLWQEIFNAKDKKVASGVNEVTAPCQANVAQRRIRGDKPATPADERKPDKPPNKEEGGNSFG